MLFPIAAALAVLVAAADPPPVNPSAEPADAAAKAAAAKKADQEKIVCRTEGVPNSRFKQQVCLSKKEWAERTRSGEEVGRELGNRPVVNLAPGN